MLLSRRKAIAVFALLAVAVMLWLERHEILRGSGESFFWLGIGALAIVLAVIELASRDSPDAPK